MNPEDAALRGLVAGDDITVHNGHGSVDAVLAYDDTLKPGVVAMTHGWGQPTAHGLDVARRNPGANVNRLAPTGTGGYDVLSNQSHLTGINVDVARRRIGQPCAPRRQI